METYDVVVVGGGAAGLSGAVALARSRRSVLVVDEGEPRNAPAHGVHNLLGQEGRPPAELLAAGRDELRGYGGTVVSGTAVSARRTGEEEFEVELAEPLGADTLLHGRFGAARELVTVRQGGHVIARPGEMRHFKAEPGHLHLFDSQTGKRFADT